MDIDEVLYSHLTDDSLMILPPKGFPSLLRSDDPNFGSFKLLGPSLGDLLVLYSVMGGQIQPYWARASQL